MANQHLKLSAPNAEAASIVLISGDPGVGKTTLAGKFPKPVVIPIEGGEASLSQINTDALVFPRPRNKKELLEQFDYVAQADHDRVTLVIDSVSALIAMFEQSIVESDSKAQSIAQAGGGYGGGQRLLAAKCQAFIQDCIDLRDDRGMNIVWIGHLNIEEVPQPDTANYERYTIRGHKDSSPKFIQHADMHGLVRLKQAIVGTEKEQKVVDTGDGKTRLFFCAPSSALQTKNRFGIMKMLEWTLDGELPFVHKLAQSQKQHSSATQPPVQQAQQEVR